MFWGPTKIFVNKHRESWPIWKLNTRQRRCCSGYRSFKKWIIKKIKSINEYFRLEFSKRIHKSSFKKLIYKIFKSRWQFDRCINFTIDKAKDWEK